MANQSPARDRTDVRIPELVGALNFRDMGGYVANEQTPLTLARVERKARESND